MAKIVSFADLKRQGLDAELAAGLEPSVNAALTEKDPILRWRRLVANVLTPTLPFAVHSFLHARAFHDWPSTRGPAPVWIPDPSTVAATHITDLQCLLQLPTYSALHAWSVTHRQAFWELMLSRLNIHFDNPYRQILDLSSGPESPDWLPGATLNISDSCFNADKDAIAIVWQNVEGVLCQMTYGELRQLSGRVAHSLANFGMLPGSRIGLVLPMSPESVALYLGIISAGCVAVGIADSFSATEIAKRLRLVEARMVFTQDHLMRSGRDLPLYARVIEANVTQIVVLPSRHQVQINLRPSDVTWSEFLGRDEALNSVPCPPQAHTNILFSSGTTGEPKAIPWTHTTPIKCAADGYLHHDIHHDDVVAWPTGLGWMMGPWLIYATLINRATIAIFPDSPTGRDFGRFVEKTRVTMLGLVPSLVRSWRDSECMHGLDWSSIRAFSSTGECSDAHDMHYLMALASYRPVIEYCGGTEIGGGYITGTMVQPAAPATFTTPALGMDFVLLDETNTQTDNGEVFLVPPSIGLSTELLDRNHNNVYYDRAPTLTQTNTPLRRHGDQIERLPEGYFRAHGRVDDTMNLSGIKVSSTELERVFNAVEGIHETAAIAVSPQGGGPSQLVTYVIPATKCQNRELVLAALQSALRQNLNPLFKITDVVIVDALPRTTSNKVLRRQLRDQYIAAEI